MLVIGPRCSRVKDARGALCKLLTDTPLTTPVCANAQDPEAMGELFCVAFALLERRWSTHKATYLDFPAQVAAVRLELEHALSRHNAAGSVADLRRSLKL